MNFGLSPLSVVIFFPLLGCVAILFLKENQRNAIRWTGLAASILEFGVALWVLAQFDPTKAGLQMEINLPWLQVRLTGGLSPGDRRAEHPHGPANHLPDALSHPLGLEVHRPAG